MPDVDPARRGGPTSDNRLSDGVMRVTECKVSVPSRFRGACHTCVHYREYLPEKRAASVVNGRIERCVEGANIRYRDSF